MAGPSNTRERILEASRRLFNEHGYVGTPLAQIAAEVGITEGNLWYHFRTKRELVTALEKQVRRRSHEMMNAISRPGLVLDVYVSCVLRSMKLQWEHRFLLRDHLQFSPHGRRLRRDPDMTAQFEKLQKLLLELDRDGMFRRDLPIDLRDVARSAWMVSRYWADHLVEQEGVEKIRWVDQERGFRQHLAVLQPYLTAPGRRALEAAAAAAIAEFEAEEINTMEYGT